MKLHCFKESTLRTTLGTSNIISMKDEQVKVEFKDVLPVQTIFPEDGNRDKFVCIDSWTKTSKYRAVDLKDELFSLGVTVYLIDTHTKELLTTFVPKNSI